MTGVDGPRKVLMTADAVGGVWRYAMDLAASQKAAGSQIVFLGFGPAPDAPKKAEAEAIGTLHWRDLPLDWMVQERAALSGLTQAIEQLVREEEVDLVHLNQPSQAAGLDVPVPVVTVAHSCVPTWFAAVRNGDTPPDWAWHKQLNAEGLIRADAIVAPSHAFAQLLQEVYGPLSTLHVIHNASRVEEKTCEKDEFCFAAARWWDDGKDGATLDAAAAQCSWPLGMAGPVIGPGGDTLALRYARHMGELPHAQVLEQMRRAAIFVSPSVYEPFGLAALEAARLGCALVLSDIPVYRELWDGAALFAAPHDPESLASAINILIGDGEQRRELARAAEKRSRRYTAGAQNAAMQALYAQLFSTSSKPAAAE